MYHRAVDLILPAVKRCGNIAIVGRPNVGKSTLMNDACGMRLSAVSPRPQTTRVQVMGISTRGESQLVFVDTPGYNQVTKALGRAMQRRVAESLAAADAVLIVVDVFPALQRAVAERGPGAAYVHPVDARIVSLAAGTGKPIVLAINKIDVLGDRGLALPIIAAYDALGGLSAVVPMSARSGLNMDRLLDVLSGLLPEGEHAFPADQVTDRPERFFVAEIVRESAFHLLREEIPYAVAVEVEHWIEEEGGRLVIDVRLLVETESQKKIAVGKGGSMVKEIGTSARRRIQGFLGRSVHLGLTVVVRKDWTLDPTLVERLIEAP